MDIESTESAGTEVTGGQDQSVPVSDQNLNNVAQPETSVAPAEKMIPQSQVNKIAAREAHQAAEKAKREAYAEFQRQSPKEQPADKGIGGMPGQDPEQIRQLIREEAYRLSNEEFANRLAKDFESKIEQAKVRYPDFDEKYDALNIEQHPELVLMTQGMDNVGDVMYDIANNPAKVAQILMLSRGGFPQLAQQELVKLSASIAANEAAKKTPDAPAPLSQVKPSNVGADNGDMGVSDFRKQSWLRG